MEWLLENYQAGLHASIQSQDPMHEDSFDDKNESSLRSDSHLDVENVSDIVDPNYATTSAVHLKANILRRGSARILESTTLLHSSQKMHAPYTQETPPMTEDMHEERLRAVEAFGDAFQSQCYHNHANLVRKKRTQFEGGTRCHLRHVKGKKRQHAGKLIVTLEHMIQLISLSGAKSDRKLYDDGQHLVKKWSLVHRTGMWN